MNEPFEAYLKIIDHFRPFHPTKILQNENAVIGERTVIMPNAFIGKDVKIGNDCIIHPNVTLLDYTEIGITLSFNRNSDRQRRILLQHKKEPRCVVQKNAELRQRDH
jgi:acyl-[acyl carrier protein]--UDP-N-acetylglucosamine O-acyltransferase